ncbi:Cation/H(+) antiporter 19 [Ananas comosus]|uniref:Cation/H(+) antiporter 19 n=1 Tax=Ananas comosus TaxID=4615 RepID=A0A199UIF7_ANACO|nr:Cation/H(+) antiporter 19 [Ananas comosus]
MATTTTTGTGMCPGPMKATSEGAWQGDDPLHFALPLIILQICLVVALTRALAFLLRPLRQPRVIAEIIGGILLGPSALGRSSRFMNAVFPKQSLTVLDTVANIGLLFFLFLVGLELDLRAIRRTGRSAVAIALAGISLPFVLGIGTSVVLRATVVKGTRQGPFLVFMGVALSITAFPVLARILAELKLLTTDLGRMAMSAAAVNDIAAWILLALAVALSGSGSPLIALWVLLSAAAFIAVLALVLRPLLAWMARRSPDGEPVKESYICATLVAVLAAGFDGPFAGVLIEKVEDLVSGLFLPLYFVSSGLKTNVATISGARSWGLLVLVIANACLGKIVGTIAVALLTRVPPREALALGFLMNTKGLVELIVLNIGRDRKPVMAVYKPARLAAPYKHRTFEGADASAADAELRVLACFHASRSIPTLINLIETSRGTSSRRRRRLVVYALHLVELSERPSSILMVQRARRNGMPFSNRRYEDTSSGNNRIGGGDEVVQVAFEAYRQLSSVVVRPMTAVSDLDTIHEDIVASAHRKRAALIVLPFHKTLRVDGSLESLGHAYHEINRRVLRRAPCSVAILVDRGLGGAAQVSSSDVSYTVTTLFFGGPDDREALAYTSRMAEHPGIAIAVIRFLNPAVTADADEDRQALEAFRAKAAADGSVRYEEREAQGSWEVAAAIKELGRGCNLFLVGRSPPTEALLEKTDCPELGPVGSYLASSEFSSTASVLVIHRYDASGDTTKPTVEEGTEEGSADDSAVVPVR